MKEGIPLHLSAPAESVAPEFSQLPKECPPAMDLLAKIRTVPDFPRPGIQFMDITTLLEDGDAYLYVMNKLVARYRDCGITHVVGIESRGFIFGAALASHLGVGFVPVRKLGKLPVETIQRSYELEYGNATVEMHRDALTAADRVVIVDDLLATGGTLRAARGLVEDLGATIHEIWVLIELGFLPGRNGLEDVPLHSELLIGSE